MSKKKGKVRQAKTDFQKVFEGNEDKIEFLSWLDNAPEVLHISFTLLENDFEKVHEDFKLICDEVERRKLYVNKFCFTLSLTIELVKKDPTILNFIFNTCFKEAFQNILFLYKDLLEIEFELTTKPSFKLMMRAYKQILDGRADISILSKYLMLKRFMSESPDVIGLFKNDQKENILMTQNVSSIMAQFTFIIKLSKQMNEEFCSDIWFFNYFNIPFMHPPDDSKFEEDEFKKYEISIYSKELKTCWEQFKEINLIGIFPQGIAEVKMGLVGRILSLNFDVIEFVEIHKGEVADITLRSAYESHIMLIWLLIKDEPSNYQRFREFSTGKEKFMGLKLSEMSEGFEEIQNEGKKIACDALNDAGVRDFMVAQERGDIFNDGVFTMAESAWGKDNIQYFLYKRLCETTHGHWRVVEKYHLSKSLNPMHRGLLEYNVNNNKFNGLTPAFMAIIVSCDSLLAILALIDEEFCTKLESRIKNLRKKILEVNFAYLGKKTTNKK